MHGKQEDMAQTRDGIQKSFCRKCYRNTNVILSVSGGTMVVVLNVYDEILDTVSIQRFVNHI